jgi:hypothetical protein
VGKERGRNGCGKESDLGFGIDTLFITEVAVEARNIPQSHVKVFEPDFERGPNGQNVTPWMITKGIMFAI